MALHTGGPGADAKATCFESLISLARRLLWHSDFKETNVFSPLTRKDSVLWGASLTEK